jgi:hypothetical protein
MERFSLVSAPVGPAELSAQLGLMPRHIVLGE